MVVVLHTSTTRSSLGYSCVLSAGSLISITTMIAHSISTISQVMTTCAVADMKYGRRVMIFFFEPARMRAMRLVFVTSAPYIMANEKPGRMRVTKQLV
jgi:hypothetical protein